MNTLDLILIIPIAIGAVSGFRKGFIIGIISLLALVLGVIGGFYFLNWGVSILINQFGLSGRFLPILAFLLIFVGIIIVVNFIGAVLKKIVHLILLGGLDKIAGALVGAFMWAFLISAFIWVASVFKINFPPNWQEGSFLFDYVKPIAPMVAGMFDGIIPAASDILDGLGDLIDSATK
ncbi:MAG: CvpA family protein [Cyclobacteriaceae bacterium]|nr:CvpA family protein [Cyclobacteriaceae bacterium]